jgi:hypothetical protein
MTADNAHLETKFVFLDTEAFVREKFDWNSRSFVRLKELAKSHHVRIVTTSITKNEVRRKIGEILGYAANALNKYDVPLGQLGIPTKLDTTVGLVKLETLFEDFLTEVRAIEIPLDTDLEVLFRDYFKQLPPFSEKKKSEFPDAVVVSSLRQWCAKRFCKVYVVSGDPDLKTCCDEVLLHADTVNEVISRATVTKQLHDSLLEFVKYNDQLRDELILCLQGKRVRVAGQLDLDSEINVTGAVYHASEVNIFNLNVISQRGVRYSCEIEFDVWLDIELELEVESGIARSIFEDGRTYIDTESTTFSFVAEATIIFDQKIPDKIEIESFDFEPEIEIRARDLDIFRRLRRNS